MSISMIVGGGYDVGSLDVLFLVLSLVGLSHILYYPISRCRDVG
jgi:hypothetical protein